jgi:hypothetical protein
VRVLQNGRREVLRPLVVNKAHARALLEAFPDRREVTRALRAQGILGELLSNYQVRERTSGSGRWSLWNHTSACHLQHVALASNFESGSAVDGLPRFQQDLLGFVT